MSIAGICEACSHEFTAKDSLAGQKVKCPKCHAATRVPGEKLWEPPDEAKPPSGETQNVKVVDIDVPLWSMMRLIVCFWAATICIFVLLGMLWFIVMMLLSNSS